MHPVYGDAELFVHASNGQSHTTFPGTPLGLYAVPRAGKEKAATTAGVVGEANIKLTSVVHMREADPVRCTAVNPQFPLLAVAGRTVTILKLE